MLSSPARNGWISQPAEKGSECESESSINKHLTGDFAIVTLEGEDPADAFAKFGQGTDTFAQWYTACVLEIHGTELGKTPPDSFPTLVVDSGSGQGDIFSDLAKWFG